MTAFLAGIDDQDGRQDARRIARLCRKISGRRPQMWGASIVGYGVYHYQYASGREGDYFRLGFAPRKRNCVIYFMSGYKNYHVLLKKLGKHKLGKSCLYITRLEYVDFAVLEEIMRRAW